MPFITTTFTTYATEDRAGAVAQNWNPAQDAQIEDGSSATLSKPSGSSSGTKLSRFLKCSDIASKIPNSSTVDGIFVRKKRFKYNSDPFSLNVYDESILIDASGTISNNKADTGTNWPLTLTFKEYGSSTDKWGLILSPTVVNDPNFSVKIAINYDTNHPASIGIAGIDFVEITIYYTLETPLEETKSRVFLIT